MRVRFDPQAWVNDYAMSIDPEGPTEWEVSEAGLREINSYNDPADALAYETWFLVCDNAPQWVKEHRGPFYVEEVEA